MTVSPSSIRNLIFDLGGVILNIDYSLTSAAFKKLGAADFDDLYSQARQNDLFDRLERGEVDARQFAHEARLLFQKDWTDGQIIDAWNAMLIDLPMERIRLLEKLSGQYRLFLLSNTNDIHLAGCRELFRATVGRPDLGHIFLKEYYSNLLGMRKPEERVFRHILEEQGIDASSTLFIDDSIQHVEGARKAGLHAFHLERGNTITEVFKEW